MISKVNEDAMIISTPIVKLTGAQVLEAMEHGREEEEICPVCGHAHHEHHHHDYEEGCCCGHDHHEHHHHDHTF